MVLGLTTSETASRGESTMSLVLTSGWHPALHRAEINAALGRIDPDVDVKILGPRCLHVETTLSDKELLAHLSLTAGMDMLLVESGMCVGNISQEDLIDRVTLSLVEQVRDDCRLRVDVERHRSMLSSFSRREIAKGVGAAALAECSEITIDLTNPNCTIQVILTAGFSAEPLVVWGRRLNSHPPRRGWNERAPTRRPFFQPIALDVRVARSLIHLGASYLRSGESLCDPCSGTGGILIEAALSGVPAVGVDLDPDMVRGSRENLRWIGAGDEQTCMFGDSTHLSEVLASGGSDHEGRWPSPPPSVSPWPFPIGSLIFDPPYGRNAWTSEGPALTERVLTEAARWMRVGSGVLFLCAIEPDMIDTDHPLSLGDEGGLGDALRRVAERIGSSGWNVTRGFGIHVHSSMSRLMVEAVLGER